jgi:UDP-GlcNAc:undecaprenyl-phosphate GlcNAc-1-phosphate transferase
MLQLLYLPVLTSLLLFYFRLAVQFKIIDKPNQRSSHSRITIRGAGIIFPIAILLQALFSGFQYPLFTSGLLLISIVSFYDDLRPLSNKIRLLVHLLAVSLLFHAGGFDGLSRSGLLFLFISSLLVLLMPIILWMALMESQALIVLLLY